jgi:pilus assembly protein CpaF
MAITEVQRMESDVVTMQELYSYQVDAVASDGRVVGKLVGTGLRPGFLEKFDKRGVNLPSWLAASTPSALAPQRSRREVA